jgi:hypothetical protein
MREIRLLLPSIWFKFMVCPLWVDEENDMTEVWRVQAASTRGQNRDLA